MGAARPAMDAASNEPSVAADPRPPHLQLINVWKRFGKAAHETIAVRNVDLLVRSGEFVTLHVVGRRSAVEPAPAWVEGPGRLVCIGVAAKMDRSAVLAALGSDFRLLPSPRRT